MTLLGTITNEPLRSLVDRMYRLIDHQPELLLETGGGPIYQKADICVARLYGHDDQLDHEWRIDAAAPYLLTPIRPRLSLAVLSADQEVTPSMRTARYSLQSNYAKGTIAGEYVQDVVAWKPQIEVLCLRYRRDAA